MVASVCIFLGAADTGKEERQVPRCCFRWRRRTVSRQWDERASEGVGVVRTVIKGRLTRGEVGKKPPSDAAVGGLVKEVT